MIEITGPESEIIKHLTAEAFAYLLGDHLLQSWSSRQ